MAAGYHGGVIWHEATTIGVHSAYKLGSWVCPFCGDQMARPVLIERPLWLDVVEIDRDGVFVQVCATCGWWHLSGTIGAVFGTTDPLTPGEYSQREVAATAALKNLDVTTDTAPVDEVRRYLVARAEAGRELHPRVFEETVATVFRDLGFDARVTAYSGDGGIDIILDGPDGKTIGVQVKRYEQRIKVEQIRSFVGALILEGHCRGIFVTTSDYQRGCYRAAEAAEQRELPITLVTGGAFREALRLTNRRTSLDYVFAQPPFTTAPLTTLCYRGAWCSGEYTYVWQSDAP